jgi:hypothetical protein
LMLSQTRGQFIREPILVAHFNGHWHILGPFVQQHFLMRDNLGHLESEAEGIGHLVAPTFNQLAAR